MVLEERKGYDIVKKMYHILVVLMTLFTLCTVADAAIVIEDTSEADMDYSGTWTEIATEGAWGAYQQNYKYTDDPGASCEFLFTGNEISVMGGYGNDLGVMDVYIDEEFVKSVDLYMPTDRLFQREIFHAYDLNDGQHCIKLQAAHEKNANSTGYGICIDRFDVFSRDRLEHAVATTSSSLENDDWSKEALTESDFSGNGWSSDGELLTNHSEWILLDIGHETYINEIGLDVAAGGVYFPHAFTIEISYDGIQWAKIAEENSYSLSGESTQTFRFATQLARLIKITGTDLRSNPLDSGYYRMQLGQVHAYLRRADSASLPNALPNQAYYVSSSAGNDANDGKSPATAWKTLERASQVQYGPGNQILLQCGDVWADDGLSVTGSGTAENPIVISSYGQGPKPSIQAGQGKAYGIHIKNEDGIAISNLAFSNSVCGVYVENTLSVDHSNYSITNCDFTQIEGTCINPGDNTTGLLRMPYPTLYFGAGIAFTGTLDASMPEATIAENIDIQNNTFSECDTGILLFVRDEPFGLDGMPSNAWYFGRKSYKDVHIADCTIDKSYRSGGIMLYSVSGVVEDCVVTRTGYEKGMHWGVAAIQAALCEDLVVDGCEMAYSYLNPGDGEGFDFEAGNKNVQLINSVIHDNEGPAILFYGQNGGWKNDNEGNVVKNCLIYNNGTDGAAASWSERVFKSYPNNTGVVEDCYIKLKYADQPCDAAPHTVRDNVIYNEDGELYGLTQTVTVSDWDAAVFYSAYGWVMDYDSRYTDGFAHQSRLADAYLEFPFDGTGIKVISSVSAGGGSFDVFLDNVYQDTVSCAGAEAQYGVVVCTLQDLEDGLHTLKLVSKTDAPVSYDGFVVTKPASTVSRQLVSDWDPEVQYSAYGWVMDYHDSYTNGFAHQSLLAGTELTYSFSGTGIEVISAKFTNGGSFDAYLDGVLVETVSCRSAETEYGAVVLQVHDLTPGEHTLKLVSKSADPVSYDGFLVLSPRSIPTYPEDAPLDWSAAVARFEEEHSV